MYNLGMKIALQKAHDELDDWQQVLAIEATQKHNKLYHQLDTVEDEKELLKDSEIFFICQGKTIVGYASYDKKTGEINGLIVLPDYRSQGIGTMAIAELLKNQKAHELQTAWLVTHPENNGSLIVYLSNGFKIVGFLDNHFGDGEPRLKLEKTLR
jgi:ribosomal protein S18 acetylase RimI-like enzyme